MTASVDVCNRALQKIGAATRIMALTDNTREARACNVAYAMLRRKLLRQYPWSFAMTRVVLSPDVAVPAFDFKYQFTLPADCLRVLLNNDNTLDWKIEGRKLLTNGGTGSDAIEGSNLTVITTVSSPAPAVALRLTYLTDVTDENVWDTAFVELMVAAIAYELVEEITQSNQKKEALRQDLKDAQLAAYNSDSLEKIPEDPPEDYWIAVRR